MLSAAGPTLVQYVAMSTVTALYRQLRVTRLFAVPFVAIVVASHAVFILATTLLDQLALHHGSIQSALVIDLPLMVGLSLLYLSAQLRRRKRIAWLVTVLAYSFYLGLGFANVVGAAGIRDIDILQFVRVAVLPLAIIGLLFAAQREFVVRSDIQGFRWAARFSLIILVVAFVYGVVGFSLLDKSDFHQEIRTSSAAHYTIDQFDLTTDRPLHPYTKRAKLFVSSLTFVSIAAVGYAVLSLFQPLRSRFSDQTANRQQMLELLERHPAPSEDFFKLWPQDKQYFFDETRKSGLALHVYRGVALSLGDPAGDPHRFKTLLQSFQNLCYGNGWLPAFIHVQDNHRRLYERQGYSLQRIGQEAVVEIERFQTEVARNKYFRHISNKFTKQNVSCEMLLPPHHDAVVQRLRVISDEWLAAGGRTERGFAMGYYSTPYIQQCPVMVARDAAGTIQAFINQLPAHFDREEATFDMLRHTSASLGNINDFLLLNFISHLQAQGYQRLNLGLCPLVGLDEVDEDGKSLIDGVLRFAYANGDRFYSFSGLYRFKVKYEPVWRDRYIAYQGGLRGFTRTTNALMRAMRVK